MLSRWLQNLSIHNWIHNNISRLFKATNNIAYHYRQSWIILIQIPTSQASSLRYILIVSSYLLYILDLLLKPQIPNMNNQVFRYTKNLSSFCLRLHNYFWMVLKIQNSETD